MLYLQYQSVFYSDVSMLIGYQHKKIGASTISKRQQSGFEDGEAHECRKKGHRKKGHGKKGTGKKGTSEKLGEKGTLQKKTDIM